MSWSPCAEFGNGGAIPASCLSGPFLVSRFCCVPWGRSQSRRPTRTFRERGARLWFGRRGLEAHHAASSPIRFCQKRCSFSRPSLEADDVLHRRRGVSGNGFARDEIIPILELLLGTSLDDRLGT